MLTVTIPPGELFDENTMKFIPVKGATLKLEHSLVSVSKWESKWHKIFLDDKTTKTNEELVDYVRCMTLTQNVDPYVYYNIPSKTMNEINEYIKNPMTATHFNEENLKKMSVGKTKNDEKMSSELIYYWMISAQIPFECEKWHLNRLLTLIRVCGIKNQPPKKMSKADLASKYRNVNASRRAAHKH